MPSAHGNRQPADYDGRFKSVRVFNDVHVSIKSEAKEFGSNFATLSRAQDRVWRRLPRAKKIEALREAAIPA